MDADGSCFRGHVGSSALRYGTPQPLPLYVLVWWCWGAKQAEVDVDSKHRSP